MLTQTADSAVGTRIKTKGLPGISTEKLMVETKVPFGLSQSGEGKGGGGVAMPGRGKGVLPIACLLELQKLPSSLAEFYHLLLVWHIFLMLRMLLQLLQALLQQALHLHAGRCKVTPQTLTSASR